jgi:hypothetical protein
MALRALVCQRDAAVREEIAAALRARGFMPVETAEPDGALTCLYQGAFAVAVVDWQHSAGRDLIRELARHSELPTFVYDAELHPSAVPTIIQTHGAANIHHCSWGISALIDRIVGATGKTVGDLVLRDGVVFHVPSGTPCKFEVGARLLAAYPRPLRLSAHSDQQAMSRYRHWLLRVGSFWTVPCIRRGSLYRLVEAASADQAA